MNRKLQHFWNSKWLLSLLSGMLLGLSFPPFPFPFLQFFAFFFILRLQTLCTSAKQVGYFVYPGFLLWNLIATYWLMLASLPAGIAAILANAVLMALVAMLQFKAQQKLQNGWLIAILQTAFWVSFEYLHHHWDLSWPWLSLGNGWANATFLVQYISATGFLGISFWVMLGTTLAYQAWRRNKNYLKWSAAAVILFFPILSFIQMPYVSNQSDIGQKAEVVVAQPNFDSYQNYETPSAAKKTQDLLIRLSGSARTPQTDLVLWPENGLHPFISNHSTVNFAANRAKKRMVNQAKKWNTTIIAGTAYIDYFTESIHPPLPQWSGDIPYLTYNSAVGFYPDGDMQVYRKHNLVTVVERFPFLHFFSSIDLFNWIDWADIQGYGQGNDADQFKVGATKAPALICYDSVYPGWIRNFVLNGAGFLTVITNDGWWGNTSGHIQHFDYARLRAIEFHRWVVRSANNGISGVIAPDGSIKKKTKFWTRTAFRYDVPIITQKTFYTRFGDWLPISLLFISIGGIILLLFKQK